ncbi:MAG TPA: hypothetical protein VJU79_08235 [Candidatus Dormibacteraeota bacterium]|nr:hypothetical protein [Candidatus Dormibacteraeota bacterium]
MLGRIGSGSAVAALWLGGLAIAVGAHDHRIAWLCFAGVVVTMVVTLGPWIPKVRDALPSQRRLRRLEAFWLEGDNLRLEPVSDEEEWVKWQRRYDLWLNKAANWIATEISPVEAQRFVVPPSSVGLVSDSFNPAHSNARMRIIEQLWVLIRLRDDEKPA